MFLIAHARLIHGSVVEVEQTLRGRVFSDFLVPGAGAAGLAAEETGHVDLVHDSVLLEERSRLLAEGLAA